MSRAGSGAEPDGREFERLAGWAGIVTGVAGAGYAVSFVAFWVLVIGVASALGASVHGGFDLANALHAPAASVDFPSPSIRADC